jgi:pimeloyl-ACP methyl ester carboxylesterase
LAAIGWANPLRHLTGDAAYLAVLLGTISGPIILVGHSYGGAVISNAATGNQQVKALVFCDGWMPDEGESIQQLFENMEVLAGQHGAGGAWNGPGERPSWWEPRSPTRLGWRELAGRCWHARPSRKRPTNQASTRADQVRQA